MCDQDQTEAFVSPGYDENLHACSVCLASGLSMKDQSYCEACSMGDKMSKFDAYAQSLAKHGMKDALRIVFRATTKTEKARAAAKQAMLIAGHQRATKAMIDGFAVERNALLARIGDFEHQHENMQQALQEQSELVGHQARQQMAPKEKAEHDALVAKLDGMITEKIDSERRKNVVTIDFSDRRIADRRRTTRD